jgi:TolA-binding protein
MDADVFMPIRKISLFIFALSVSSSFVSSPFAFSDEVSAKNNAPAPVAAAPAASAVVSPAPASSAPSPAAQKKSVPPAVKEADKDEQSSYVYDLRKLIEKSKDNIKRVNEKIQEQAIYKRNQQREEKAREYYERAVQLFEEGKTNEARDLWEKSIKITEHPEMKDYIKGSERRFKLQAQALKKEGREREARTLEEQRAREQQVSEAYATAVTLYKQKKFKPSREEFMLVEQLIPEYKATRSYLKLLEQNIAIQDKDEAKNQQKEIARQQEEAEAARSREKEQWRKEIELKEQERRAKLLKQAQDVYKQALDLYNKKDFVGAKEKFQEVEWVIPDFKSTRKYLDRLDADIKKHETEFQVQKDKERAKQGWEDELARKKREAENKKAFEQKTAEQKREDMQEAEVDYQAGIKLLTDKKYDESRDKFLDVQKIYPEYKATTSYLARLNQRLGIVENAPAAVTDDVKAVYADAVKAYKAKDFAGAKLKFEKVEFMYPDYQATRKYLSKLDKDYDIKKVVETSKDQAILKEDMMAQAKPEAQAPVEITALPAVKTIDGKPATSEEYDKLVAKVEPMYADALKLYEDKKFDDSFKQFQSIEDMLPNYKSTRPYLKRVNQQIKKAEQQRYKEEQVAQAETINLLAKQANTLFMKIQQLSDDNSTSAARKKFALTDKLFASMSRDQEKLLLDIAEEEKKLKLEEIAYEQEVQKSEFANMIDPIYDEAVRLYQAKKYDEAKAKFLEAQSKLADYRSSSRYLTLIEKQNQLLAQVMKDREDRIKDYQVKADHDAKLQAKMQMQAKEQTMIKGLVAQAESINDEIVTLSKDRNFELIKAKFAELEKVVDNLITIKKTAAQREEAERYGVKVLAARQGKSADGDRVKETGDPAAEEENKAAIARLTAAKAAQGRRGDQVVLSEKQRFRAMDKQNRELYHQAVRDYDGGRYSEAKMKFIALEQQPGYSSASHKYINAIDQVVLKKQVKYLAKQDKSREDFLKNRLERERMSYQVKEAGVDASIADRAAKTETFAQGAVTSTVVHGDYLDSLSLRGRKVEPQVISEQQIANMKEIVPPEDRPIESPKKEIAKAELPPVNEDLSAKPADEPPPGISPNEDASRAQRRKQKALSDKRKKYLDEKFKEEQKKKEEEERKEQAALKAAAQGSDEAISPAPSQAAVETKISRRQRALELKQQSLYAKELRRAKDPGYERALAAVDAQDRQNEQAEIRRQQEALRQQREDEMAERTDKERKIATVISQGQDVEGAPKTDLNALRTARLKKNVAVERQPKASTVSESPSQNMQPDAAAMRKQFESGVDDMYREAMSYYKSGMYKEARDKFSDIEDLSPDYKKTRNFIERTQQAILKDQKRRGKVKDVSMHSLPQVAPREDLTSAAPVGKQDAVASALDSYESELK